MHVLAEASGEETGQWFLRIALLVIVAAAILWPFRRLKGGEQPNTSVGAEKAIVGVLWLLGAIALGIVVASR